MAKIETTLVLPRAKLSSSSTVITFPKESSWKILSGAREAFQEGRTLSLKFRKTQLKGLLRLLEENQKEIIEALHRDLRKPAQEVICHEVEVVANEVRQSLICLEKWMRPEKPDKDMVNWLDGVYIYNEPYGVVLVIGPWNYPLQLCLSPLVGAMAAGNCVVLKPSELAPATGQIIYDLLPKYVDSQCYPVYLGGIPETSELLEHRFDYIFYTGSPTVGKIIHQAAAKHLTPATLELGGKSPVYIDATADLHKTVQRIMWGKCVNSGQTCIAPDYVICSSQEIRDRFVKIAEKVIADFYGPDLKQSGDYARIINERNFDRLINLMSGLKIALGGKFDPKDKYIEPTIVIDVTRDDKIMQEEIFGPILPVLIISDIYDVIDFVNKGEKPLALYIFSKKTSVRNLLLERISAGGVVVNDTILHFMVDSLPFGGVGNSGMGAYHGKGSFDTFTHKKAVLVKNFQEIPDKLMSMRFPPYSDTKIALTNIGLKKRRGLSMAFLAYLLVFLLGILVAVAGYYLYQFIENN